MNTINNQFTRVLSRTWWLLLLRGLIAIAFGILIWLQPEISIVALVLIFGAYVLVDGVLGIWTAIAGRKEHEDWWVLFIWGSIGVGIGILTFLAPGVTALALLFYIAVWAVATGVLEIVAAIRLRKEIRDEWLLVLGGLVSVIFGILLMAQPVAGALALLWLIAIYGVIFGIFLVILAFRVRSFGKS
ncbi:HdeD family acid-resistance protein [Nitrosomonas sp.]|uniref:HdeD family acid-resistance protein n=1 Tax=Nitrosomonas sp. TaxID=42353 RepID=UPI0025FC0C84|nr:HdeD family acid-resistance protein [Nitrosomonas sp.]MCC6916022.1 HdeD family acid-resistance protein [Nitrosomonas sp.]